MTVLPPDNATPLVAVTMGDPCGVGPEIALAALAHSEVRAACRPVLIGDAGVLEAVSKRLNRPLPERRIDSAESAPSLPAGSAALLEIPVDGLDPDRCGLVDGACGRAAYAYVDHAIDKTLDGAFDALATGPIHKEALRAAGVSEPGHTEILARKCGVTDFCMMMYSPRIAVSLVTIHVPVRAAPDLVTPERIETTIRLTRDALRRVHGREVRLAVCGLNPHAGESGLFGRTDRDIIAPVIEACRRRGYEIEGPLPGDTAFTPRALARYDGYVAMYHDQGLIPFKMLAFDMGVNVTLGLPIVRTSVAHGTAFDIARQGLADPRSLVEAIKLAVGLTAGDDER
jgi:4-hydroxythreonine-4-phosphate dehydrogenase